MGVLIPSCTQIEEKFVAIEMLGDTSDHASVTVATTPNRCFTQLVHSH
jgi:hypothetical protein